MVREAQKDVCERWKCTEKDRDEYLRNPCEATGKFIIIELCETVQPLKLELANFELFSSGCVWLCSRRKKTPVLGRMLCVWASQNVIPPPTGWRLWKCRWKTVDTFSRLKSHRDSTPSTLEFVFGNVLCECTFNQYAAWITFASRQWALLHAVARSSSWHQYGRRVRSAWNGYYASAGS